MLEDSVQDRQRTAVCRVAVSSHVACSLLCLLSLLAVAGTAAAQNSAVADTAADGSITFRYQDESKLDLTPEEKISELNGKILRDPTNGDNYNNLGVIYARQENWVTARDAFLAAVQAKPTEGDFHRNLGLVLVKLEQYDLAIGEFEAYRKFASLRGADTWRLIGEAYRMAGKPDEARQEFREGLKALPPDRESEGLRLVLALNRLEDEQRNGQASRELLETYVPAANRYLVNAEKTGATEGVSQARAIRNNLLNLYIDDAKILADSGLHIEAAQTYAKALAMAPERDELLPSIVEQYIEADDLLQARVTARMARSDLPDAAGTWLATGKIYAHENRFEEAIEAYKKAREIDPTIKGLDLVIGNLYMKTGNVSEGRKYLASEIDNPDTPPEVVYNYAVSLMKEKKYSAAIRPLQRVVRERPDMVQGWSALAIALYKNKQYAQAIEPYQRTLELDPKPKHAYELGICAKKADRIDLAIEAYEQALALEPGYVEARYNYSLALMDAKRYDDAAASFDSLLVIEPDSYRAFYSQGLSLYYLGRYDEAIDAFELALEQKETVNAYNNIGLSYDKLGDKKSAQTYYKEAKKLKGSG